MEEVRVMSGFLDWLFGKGSKEVKPDPASSHTLSETSSHTITKASFRMQLSSYYTDRFDELIRAASSGDRHALPSLYLYLASDSDNVVRESAHTIASCVRDLTYAGFKELDEQFRDRTSLSYSVDWSKADPQILRPVIGNDDEYFWILRIGTFHPSGYYRAACIRALKEDPESLRFLILRLNDWAAPVREEAQRAIYDISRLSLHDLITSLPYYEKIVCGFRRNASYARKLHEDLISEIRKKAGRIVWETIREYDLPERRALYTLFLEKRSLEKEEIRDILRHEKNSLCQMKILTVFLDHYDLSVSELDAFMTYKSRLVKRKALEKKYDILKEPWEGIEEYLLSPSYGLRETIRYILRKHTSFDIRAFYIDHLDTKDRKVSILGIGENGTKEDVELLKKYLTYEEAGTVRAAIHAIASLNRNGSEMMLWQYLSDERPSVRRQAYEEILESSMQFGAGKIWDLLEKTDDPVSRKRLVVLLVREAYWDQLPYLLKLYNEKEEEIRLIVRTAIHRWRNSITGINEKQAENIRSILSDPSYGLPEKLIGKIEFDIRSSLR